MQCSATGEFSSCIMNSLFFFSFVCVIKLGRSASRLNSRNAMHKIAPNWEDYSPLAEEIWWE